VKLDADTTPRSSRPSGIHREGSRGRVALTNGALAPSLPPTWPGRADASSLTKLEAGKRRRGVEPEGISIELSPAQVDRVIRTAADGGSMSMLLSGLRDVREVLARQPGQLEDNRLSRSLLAGLLMLASFPNDGTYLGNAEIARLLDMNPSTTHRYVSTLVAVGLLERDPSTRRYRLV
jgi:IclR helix-turn-helix domain